ncbi:MAG: DUF3857 domain-containing protein [Terracidiphilus sp.]|jgi:hypothetical protein
MTADPKAPGAAAVYLYREETTDDEVHTQTYYERIKILTEKGKELATVQIPYLHGVDTVKDIQGRTIHADGSIFPLTVKPDDLMAVKAGGYQVNEVVFNLPDAEVGSILEYRLKIGYPGYKISQPIWDIQQPYFVRNAHYSFHPYIAMDRYPVDWQGDLLDRLAYSYRLRPGDKLDHDKKKNVYSADLADIAAEPDEDWMPPLNTLKWRVEFYCTKAKTTDAFWKEAGKYWANWILDFTKPTRDLRNAASGLVAPADTDEQKARKIYAAVQKLDNTDFSRKKSQVERKKEKLKDVHRAEDVWKQQSGSSNDIALLYVALARAAGLKVWPAYIVNRDRAIFDNSFLSDSQFDDDIVIFESEGKEIYLDPGQKMCPSGALHWKHTLSSGFRLADKGAVFVATPSGTYKSAVVQRIADLAIDPAGEVQGTVRLVMTGPSALYWRQLALQNDPEEVKKQFNESIRDKMPEGVQVDFDHFLGLEEYETNLIAIVKVSGNLGTATGKHFFLPGLFFHARANHPFVAQDRRSTPVDVQYPSMEQDQVIYHLPPGFAVEGGPKTADAAWAERAMLRIHFAAKDNQVEVVRILAHNFSLLDSKDYSGLHDFYLKVAAADQQQLVLTRTPAAQGN